MSFVYKNGQEHAVQRMYDHAARLGKLDAEAVIAVVNLKAAVETHLKLQEDAGQSAVYLMRTKREIQQLGNVLKILRHEVKDK